MDYYNLALDPWYSLLIGDFMSTPETAATVAGYLVQANTPYQSSMLMCMGMLLGVVIIALIFKG